MPNKTSKAQLAELLERLRKAYGDAECALDHESPFQLLVATILSAQCTDKRVNMVTPALFARYPSASKLARARQPSLEKLVQSTGFYRNKAKNLIGMAKVLVSDHGDEVPQSMAELIKLPGVARKTANVVLGVSFGIASGVVVDTHVMRISQLLGLTDNKKADRIERDLMEQLPKESWIDFSHRLIHHGRQACVARRPLCSACPLASLCPSASKAAGSR